MVSRRALLAGMGGLTLTPWLAATVRAEPRVMAYGWQPDVPAPTEADVYVSPTGNDTGAGTQTDPFRSLSRGVSALAELSGGSLAIRGGLYREAVDLGALKGTTEAPFHIHRYGTEPVTITAAERLGGWVPAAEDEARALGADAQGLYKAIVSKQSLSHGDALALNLHEANRWSPPATDRADLRDPATYGRPDTYHRARFATDADDMILALRDPRLIGRTDQEMAQVRVLLYHRPNLVSIVNIAQFDGETGTILLADQDRRMQRRGGDPVMLYGLLNAGWQIGPGQWIAREDGDEIHVYLRPLDPAALDSNIEISTRGYCLDLQGAAHVHLTGLNAIRAAGTTRQTGICIRKFDQSRTEGFRLDQCRAGENVSSGGRGYGAIFLRGTDGLRLNHVTVAETRNSFGLAVFHSRGVDMRDVHVHHAAQSPARFYGLRDAVLAFSLFEDSATDSHANKFNFYEGSDNVLVYGLRARRVGGYATFQEASRIHFAFCQLEADARARGRALASQNRTPGAGQGGPDDSGAPMAGVTSYYWNLCLDPDPADPSQANALVLGPGGTTLQHAVHNSVLHGGGFIDIYRNGADPAGEIRSHNRYTGLAFWQSARYGWQMGEAEQGLRYGMMPQGLGLDMRPIIETTLAPSFPSFTDWDLDIDGQVVDWSRPPIGCRAG